MNKVEQGVNRTLKEFGLSGGGPTGQYSSPMRNGVAGGSAAGDEFGIGGCSAIKAIDVGGRHGQHSKVLDDFLDDDGAMQDHLDLLGVAN